MVATVDVSGRRLAMSTDSDIALASGDLAAAVGGKATVVGVEDDALGRGVLAHLLQRLGYAVAEAASGIEAQSLAGGRRIDLLLAKFSALGSNGVELVKWFSANRPETKVLVAADWWWEVESCLGDLPRVGIFAAEFTPPERARMVHAVLR